MSANLCPSRLFLVFRRGRERASTLPPQLLQGRPGDEEECIRRCIGELHAAVLELLTQDFRDGGLRLSHPPLPCARVANLFRRGGVLSSPS